MEKSAVYHRPESEYAYLYQQDSVHLRLRTKKEDVQEVALLHGDPYLVMEDKWYQSPIKMKKIFTTDIFDYWFVEVSAAHRRLSYGFHLIGKDGENVFYGDRGIKSFSLDTLEVNENYFRLPYFHESDRVKTPEWVKQTVWYQIFPERFDNGDPSNDPTGTLPWGSKEHPDRTDFFGGDLQGVLNHLDYLVDLGINGIYFCPIFKAYSNHKYDTIDYFEVDPHFGDKALFKKLVEEAHKRGIRIMLDAVFNHMGYFSEQWQDVLEKQEQSAFVDWFHIRQFPVAPVDKDRMEEAEKLNYDTFSFTPSMPKLNTANLEVQEYLLKIAAYWIEEFDIDAWRLDVANEVDHQFWKKFYQVVTGIKEDFYILGEIWHSSQNWLNGDEFHGVMNYAYTETILNFFVKNNITVSMLSDGLIDQLMLYRQQTNEVMFNVLDSHDTARLLTVAKEDKDVAKMTLAFTFLQHGSPCLYYGTEIGMTGENDPDCRKCMIWDKEKQELDLLYFVKKLITLRKYFHPVLSYGELIFEELDDENKCLHFSRKTDEEQLNAWFNKGEEIQTAELFNQEVLMSLNTEIVEGKAQIAQNGFIITKVSQ
ncbi:glycoside hydrolase family 13 protein [Vagococcus elongatus]|uniref:Alpha-glycosidase n=1 Tax=Vagococcus elongatus TaxID=180344 RepID=A0A430APX5_9ENTE|nr:glycoside hydrolase family 13 protein [Vagococcus elongatus]RSU10172.1 alpha-glycosidase [Vagococcus elongatus]